MIYSVQQVAELLKLKPQNSGGKTEYHGANPTGSGATEHGFILFEEGNALDRSGKGDQDKYTSWEVAAMAGLKPEDYEPCATWLDSNPDSNGAAPPTKRGRPRKGEVREEPAAPPEPPKPKVYDNRDLEDRGVSKETLAKFAIVRKSDSRNGVFYDYPTFHADGTPARKRRKYRDPQLSGKKYLWLKDDHLAMPVGYNLDALKDEHEVWLVNGEVSVWLATQEGVPAVCALQAENKLHDDLFKALKEKGVSVVNIVFDHDDAGRAGAVKAITSAKKARIAEVRAYHWPAWVKDGYDAADFWQECYDQEIDYEKALRKLPLVTDETLKMWSMLPESEEEEKPKPKRRRSNSPGGNNAAEKAESLLERLVEDVELFHTESDAYMVVRSEDRHETHVIGSTSSIYWLDEYAESHGTILDDKTINTIMRRLSGYATRRHARKEVFVRVGSYAGRIYIDLCNENWEVVEIGEGIKGGWRVISNSPVHFRRSDGMLPLPRPERSENPQEVWDGLRDILNIRDEKTWIIAVSWLVSSLRPPVEPYPALSVSGEQDTGKTTICKMLRTLIDPSRIALMDVPGEARDLMIRAKNAHVVGFDNLSGLQKWLSDALCRLVTEGCFATRKLHTNDEEAIFSARRPIILNGIEEFMGRPDFQRRCLFIELQPLKAGEKRGERELWQEFNDLWPQVLGLLCSVISTALSRQHEVINIPVGVGLYDFARWVVAAESDLPWPDGHFLATYGENLHGLQEAAVDSSLLVQAAVALVEELGDHRAGSSDMLNQLEKTAAKKLVDADEYGSADDYARRRMLEKATEQVRESPGWPRNAVWLGRSLRRVSPLLRSAGIEFDGSGRVTGGGRAVGLSRVVEAEEGADIFDGVADEPPGE